MKHFIILLISLSMAVAQDICIRGYLHERSTFSASDLKPWSTVAIDTDNGVLYYSGITENSTANTVRFQTLPDHQGKALFNVKEVWALYVDRHTSHLYMVANNDSTTDLNLYRYERKTKSVKMLAEKVGDTELFVYRMFAFKDQVYWIGGDLSMYRYSNGKIGKHNINLEAYSEDIEGSRYYIKANDEHHVYKVKKGEKQQQRFVGTDFVSALKMDARGKVYAGSITSYKLYEISEEHGRLVQVSDELPGSPTYMNFDQANDLIWANKENEFLKYTSTLKTCEYKK